MQILELGKRVSQNVYAKKQYNPYNHKKRSYVITINRV